MIVEVDIPEDQKVLLADGRERPSIGCDDSEKVVYEQPKFHVKVTRRYKYGNLEAVEGELGVLHAPLPETLLPRCMADDTLLAHVAAAKYGDHLPAYRLEQIFKRSDSTLIKAATGKTALNLSLLLNCFTTWKPRSKIRMANTKAMMRY